MTSLEYQLAETLRRLLAGEDLAAVATDGRTGADGPARLAHADMRAFDAAVAEGLDEDTADRVATSIVRALHADGWLR